MLGSASWTQVLRSARRERCRGDRPVGLARSQSRVYAHGEFDIAVDTTSTGPDACATAIAEALGALPSPKAFDRLRRRDI
ncbi:phosphotransferase-like protein [Micromonospora sp. NPDC004704]